MKKGLSVAILALLSLITSQDAVKAVQIQNLNKAESELNEGNRYITSNGEAINLAQTQGHLRLELTKIKKHINPVPIDGANLMISTSCQNINSTASLSETDSVSFDDITHCPINKDGTQVTAHIFQNNLQDNAYVSEMYVGNPPQLIKALFDTGSTNTWILNDNVQLPNGASKERSFIPDQSKSFANTPQKAKIFFGSGNLAGNFVTDDVRLGSCDGTKSSGQIHIKNQKFGNVLQQTTIFTGSNFEAIVGMAYPALAEPGVTPIFDEMMNQKLLQSNIFAFYLTTLQDEAQGYKSDLSFGYYDKAKYSGDIHWNDIKFKYMFGVQLDDIKVNGKNLNICSSRPDGCLITFDSGTSLMSVPSYAHQFLVDNKIPTAHSYVECENKNQFGEFTLVIGGKDYPLSPDEWMFEPQRVNLAQGGSQMQFSMGPLGPQIFAQLEQPEQSVAQTAETQNKIKKHTKGKKVASKDSKVCASTIMKMDIKQSMFLVGDIFMRKYYTIFDRDNDRVGLAKSVTGGQSSGSSSSFSELNQKQNISTKQPSKK